MISRFRSFCRALLRRRQIEADMDAELRFHIEAYTEDLVRSGVPRVDAARRARMEFGGLAIAKEECRQSLGLRLLDDLRQDLRYAARAVRNDPGFTAVAVLTLALGIGANTAVFSVVNSVVLRPLRFPQSERLMTILISNGKTTFPPIEHRFAEWREGAGSAFAGIAGAVKFSPVALVHGEPRTLRGGMATVELFDLLGVRPVAGRPFLSEESKRGSDLVVLLDAGFCLRELGSDRSVVGQSISVGGVRRTIVGILPSGFRFADFGPRDFWVPLPARHSSQFGGGYSPIVTVARLRPDVTREQAQALLDAVMSRLPQPRDGSTQTAVVKPLRDWIVGDVRRTYFTLLGAAAFILFIACANVANLLMAKATVRGREMALRSALGASKCRLVRQTLAESVFLGAMGGVAGVVLALALVRAVPAIRAIEIPRINEVGVDGTMLLAAAVVSIGGGILFGLVPALQLRSPAKYSLQRATGRHAGPSSERVRRALVAVQLALAMVLLSGAGLMTNTLLRLLTVDLGFERTHVLSVEVHAGGNPQALASSMRSLAADIRGMPGVQEAAAANSAPLQDVLDPWTLESPTGGRRSTYDVQARAVDPGYIRTLGVPLLAGRDLELADDTRTPMPVLLSKTAAEALFGRENPVGATIASVVGPRRGSVQVVGVVGDVRMFGVAINPPPLQYMPLVHRYASSVLVRTAANSAELNSVVRAATRRVFPLSPPPDIQTLDERFSDEVAQPRFYFLLLGGFAVVGLAVAGVGIYGVMSYSVARRSHEFGVRMALGAERGDILRLVVGSGAKVTCAGALLGLAGAIAATRLLSSLLYGVQPGDPVTFICVAGVLVGVAIGASYLAARRATVADPNAALRSE